jgi:hypothetical protein
MVAVEKEFHRDHHATHILGQRDISLEVDLEFTNRLTVGRPEQTT